MWRNLAWYRHPAIKMWLRQIVAWLLNGKLEKMVDFTIECIAHNQQSCHQMKLWRTAAIHRKLVPVAVKLCSQLLIDVKRSLMVTITNLLSFLTTLTADCPAAKASLPFNVWVDKGKSSSLMQVLVDLLSNDNLGDNLIRSKVWIPYSFRIITASLTSVECRSWLIRTPKFLNRQCSRDIDVTTTPVSEVLWLDLLLSLTTQS